MATQGKEYRESSPAMARSLERVVRLPAYRGPLDGPNCGRPLRRGNEDAAAGKARPKRATNRKDRRANGTARAGKQRVLARTRKRRAIGSGNGDTLAAVILLPRQRLLGLTDSSSATAHGGVDVEYRERPTAMSRSLERVVRRRLDD